MSNYQKVNQNQSLFLATEKTFCAN